MRPSRRHRLHFGPYQTPRFRYGQRVQCAIRGELIVVGITDGRIPWPIGKGGSRGNRSLVLYKDLVRAVRRESLVAIRHWWGVCPLTVQRWRRALDVPAMTMGSRRLKAAYALSSAGDKARRAGAKAWTAQRRKRISVALTGRKRSAESIAKVRAALMGKKLSAKHRRRISEGMRRRRKAKPNR